MTRATSLTDVPPCVVLCAAAGCRGKDWDRLVARLSKESVAVAKAKCLGVCEGPVAVTPLGGKIRVAKALRSDKKHRSLVEAIQSGSHRKIRKSLVKGGRRDKAKHRAEREQPALAGKTG